LSKLYKKLFLFILLLTWRSHTFKVVLSILIFYAVDGNMTVTSNETIAII